MKRIHRKIIDRQARCILKNIDKMWTLKEAGYHWKDIEEINAQHGPNYNVAKARLKIKSMSKFHLAAMFRKLPKEDVFNFYGSLEVNWFVFKKVIIEYTVGPLNRGLNL